TSDISSTDENRLHLISRGLRYATGGPDDVPGDGRELSCAGFDDGQNGHGILGRWGCEGEPQAMNPCSRRILSNSGTASGPSPTMRPGCRSGGGCSDSTWIPPSPSAMAAFSSNGFFFAAMIPFREA